MPRAAADKGAAKPKPKPRKVNGYKFPKKLPQGEILTDTAKKQWKLGPSIGQGGFGEIYSASSVGSSSNTYVIKIEPHENGPLFVERNIYLKLAKPEDVDAWKGGKGLKVLGIPGFYGSGSHEYAKEKYRFIVIQRFGRDLWSIFLENKKKFPAPAVFKCALQVIDVLQYMHEKGYIHGDIKGANLLLGLGKGMENQIYLVDFGLACKYNTKEFKKDPKKAHNGTIEYTSRDWHIGVPTRRGDMEILGYNLLHWLGSSLPWEKEIKSPEKVYEKKSSFMEHIKDRMSKDYPQVSKVITQYLDYVRNLKHDEAPNYDFCREMFSKELKGSVNGKLDFSAKDDSTVRSHTPSKSPKKPKTPLKKTTRKMSNVTDPTESDAYEDVGSGKDSVAVIKKTPKGKATKRKTPLNRAMRKVECRDEDFSSSVEEAGSSNDDEIQLTSKAPKKTKTPPKPGLRKRSYVSAPTESDSDEDIIFDDDDIIQKTPSPKKIMRKIGLKKEGVKVGEPVGRGKGSGRKKEVVVKASWRDAPTIKSSKVLLAGEYVKDGKPKGGGRSARK